MQVVEPTYALLYRSTALAPQTRGALQSLLRRSVEHNSLVGVTGLLLFDGEPLEQNGAGGSFLQWLEGPEEAVVALFDRINRDDRHAVIRVEAEGPARSFIGTDRLFPRWSMALELPSVLPTTLAAFLGYYDQRVGRRGAAITPW